MPLHSLWQKASIAMRALYQRVLVIVAKRSIVVRIDHFLRDFLLREQRPQTRRRARQLSLVLAVSSVLLLDLPLFLAGLQMNRKRSRAVLPAANVASDGLRHFSHAEAGLGLLLGSGLLGLFLLLSLLSELGGLLGLHGSVLGVAPGFELGLHLIISGQWLCGLKIIVGGLSSLLHYYIL